ncbi:TIGR02757 family protein [Chitinophaga nivalis]|uniref:TIGR02757 family protein n=1 Tax=Chitinophaga nivalis TaxID=2991709 RepID=A0ABT3IVA8_9BACT|nr:TIGR02757 family protein [Chitinophaga nivalis]MCW3462679.1 TIGR02757 family protein [Chitinophaga nivalis]MCW3487630.1 TIGR02757 family protein [Chitinophaga nivalis]
MKIQQLKDFLDAKAAYYNHPDFITNDPICIPHRFSVLQDIEIAGFFAAVLAWGNRTSIIKKCTELMKMMDNSPYDYIRHHQPRERMKLMSFCHRTFNGLDLLYFVEFLQHYYTNVTSLEFAFSGHLTEKDENVEKALLGFHKVFFALEHPERTRKHISTPARNSACKRLNMYLRWMVRKDENGVDFGLWQHISPSQLICPVDVHVSRVAARLGLIPEAKADWKTATALTHQLKKLDPDDPAKYDFALFGLGVIEKYV